MKFGVIKLESWSWLPDGEETMPLAFFVLTQYRRVTYGRTDKHVAIIITRASIARVKIVGVFLPLLMRRCNVIPLLLTSIFILFLALHFLLTSFIGCLHDTSQNNYRVVILSRGRITTVVILSR